MQDVIKNICVCVKNNNSSLNMKVAQEVLQHNFFVVSNLLHDSSNILIG
jgi:hypothetical protein